MQPGSEFIVDWGIAKEFHASDTLLVRPGLVGFGYWQISEDSGPNVEDDRGSNYAIGGEINLFFLPRLLQFNLRVLQEFGAEDEAESSKIVLSITNAF
ncbi:conserved hypothetical protein [Desulfamplus magnetovallimortis]|uniref:Bacterial surface antigen (D15) domain-containing protein n=1 Tax=Desulfamplus magnetovallimortis TaxID=1246637 RepID=A0A1W1HAZ4_9BACT|nr:conserved hypothetical protein [Desulfamplus magnetovallimortis]